MLCCYKPLWHCLMVKWLYLYTVYRYICIYQGQFLFFFLKGIRTFSCIIFPGGVTCHTVVDIMNWIKTEYRIWEREEEDRIRYRSVFIRAGRGVVEEWSCSNVVSFILCLIHFRWRGRRRKLRALTFTFSFFSPNKSLLMILFGLSNHCVDDETGDILKK